MHIAPGYVLPSIFGCSNFDDAQVMHRIKLQTRPTFSTYEYAAMINKSGTDVCIAVNQAEVDWKVVDKVQTSKDYAYFCLAAPSDKENKPCLWVHLRDK
jgi:hypothetical protein